MQTRGRRRVRITRDGVLFASGLAGVGYELQRAGAERPTLLLLLAGMMGLPAFLQKDEKRKDRDDE